MSRYLGFTPEEEEPLENIRETSRCTPEKLLEFAQVTLNLNGRLPTLEECKHKFGGILGPMVDFWQLREQGLL